jgi:hypothetical protein
MLCPSSTLTEFGAADPPSVSNITVYWVVFPFVPFSQPEKTTPRRIATIAKTNNFLLIIFLQKIVLCGHK